MQDAQPWLAIWSSLCVIVTDSCWRRVPNRLLLVTVIISILLELLALALGSATHFMASLQGFLLGGAMLLPFYIVGWMGAGDVKFLAVLGCVLGRQALLPIWIGGSMLLGLCVVLQLLPARLATAAGLETRPQRPGLPYAACLGVAAVAACLYPPAMAPFGTVN